MLPHGFINLSSLHSHRKKEFCFSEAVLSWMHAHFAALGSPWGRLCVPTVLALSGESVRMWLGHYLG